MRTPARRFAAAAAIAAAAAAAAIAQDAPPPPPPAAAAASATERFTLANGLRVTLRPVAGASEVAVVVLFDFGEDADAPGQSGLAHLAEHLWCTAATPAAPARTADDFMRRGASGANAQTSWDSTLFARVVAPTALDAELADAAARLAALRVTQADLDREKPRVAEELANMYDRVPALAARNAARELLHRTPAESRTARRGGVAGQVGSLALETVAAAMSDLHRAGNARLVVAGKLDAGVVAARVRELFADVPRGKPPSRAAAPAPPGAPPGAPPVATPGAPPAAADPPVVVLRPATVLVRESWACLAWRGPQPGEPGYAAFLTLAGRLATRTAVAAAGRPDAPAGIVLPLDDPGPAFLVARLADGESRDAAVARLRRVAAAILDLPGADGRAVATAFAGMLDTWPESLRAFGERSLAANPYLAALGLARREQLGIDGPALAREMSSLTADDLRAARARWFASPAAVVVVPGE